MPGDLDLGKVCGFVLRAAGLEPEALVTPTQAGLAEWLGKAEQGL